jgi:hypothetical protein
VRHSPPLLLLLLLLLLSWCAAPSRAGLPVLQLLVVLLHDRRVLVTSASEVRMTASAEQRGKSLAI